MTAEVTLLKAKALVERDGVSRRTKLRGSEIRVIVQERILEMYESGQGFRVADKLNDLMHCGNEQIELAACALFERFTRDDLRADTAEVPEIEIKDFSGKQPYLPDKSDG